MFQKQIWNNFIELKEKPYAFTLSSNKLRSSVSNVFNRSINIVPAFSLLSRAFTVTNVILVHSVIFLFYFSHTRTIASERFRGFQSPRNFQTQSNYEKIYYKYLLLYSYVCFELSFKTSESVKFLIPYCGGLDLVTIS